MLPIAPMRLFSLHDIKDGINKEQHIIIGSIWKQ
jgi:hypothetical protein